MIWHLKYWKTKPKILWNILKLMTPAIVLGIVLTISNVVNVFILGISGNEAEINACSIGVQIFSVLIFVIYAISGGANIYAGQLMGTDNIERLKENTRYKMLAALTFAVVAIVVILAVGEHRFVTLFVPKTGETKAIIHYTIIYLHYLYAVIILFGIANICYWCLNLEKKMQTAMLIASLGAFLNVLLAVLLGSGVGRLQNLGINGIGIASVVANFLVVVILVIYIIIKKPLWAPGWRFWDISRWTYQKCAKGTLSILPGEVLYPIFVLIQTTIIIHLSNPDVFSGYNIISVIVELTYSVNFGVVSSFAYLISNHLGRDEFKTAAENSKQLSGSALLLWFFGFVIILSSAFWYPNLYNISASAQKVAFYYMVSSAFNFVLYGIAYQCYMMIRLGGRFLLVSSIADVGVTYGVSIPLIYVTFYYSQHGTVIAYELLSFFLLIPYTIHYLLGISLYYRLHWNVNAIKNPQLVKSLQIAHQI